MMCFNCIFDLLQKYYRFLSVHMRNVAVLIVRKRENCRQSVKTLISSIRRSLCIFWRSLKIRKIESRQYYIICRKPNKNKRIRIAILKKISSNGKKIEALISCDFGFSFIRNLLEHSVHVFCIQQCLQCQCFNFSKLNLLLLFFYTNDLA